jgi:nitrite reductase/ring-hydroxylating ferredoxin subunit
MEFVKISDLSEAPVGKMKMFKVGEKEYLVANVNGNYYAMGNRCTHTNADLSQVSLEGNIVTCPKHKSKFDITTGKVVSGPRIPLFHPKIKDELSDIKLDADAINPAGKKSPAVRANVHLFKKTLSKAFIEDVKSGKKNDVSVGFTYDTIEKTGEWMGEKYDINHVAVGVPVGRMRAPYIGLGCDSVDFETEPANSDLTQNPASETVNSAAKIEVTLPITHENTSNLIGKLKQIANW